MGGQVHVLVHRTRGFYGGGAWRRGLTGYSEFYLGQTVLFHLGKAIFAVCDAGGHAFLQVCLFSFNAFAMFFFENTLSFDRYAAFLGGLFLSASSFMWGIMSF